MDPIDAFYQQLDSEQLLDQHRTALVRDALEILANAPQARLAGLITTPDSKEAAPLRKILERMSGGTVPEGLMVGIVPRPTVEHFLAERVGEEPWKEESWQPQQVLPVVVSTRDGFRFGFFGLGGAATQGG